MSTYEQAPPGISPQHLNVELPLCGLEVYRPVIGGQDQLRSIVRSAHEIIGAKNELLVPRLPIVTDRIFHRLAECTTRQLVVPPEGIEEFISSRLDESTRATTQREVGVKVNQAVLSSNWPRQVTLNVSSIESVDLTSERQAVHTALAQMVPSASLQLEEIFYGADASMYNIPICDRMDTLTGANKNAEQARLRRAPTIRKARLTLGPVEYHPIFEDPLT